MQRIVTYCSSVSSFVRKICVLAASMVHISRHHIVQSAQIWKMELWGLQFNSHLLKKHRFFFMCDLEPVCAVQSTLLMLGSSWRMFCSKVHLSNCILILRSFELTGLLWSIYHEFGISAFCLVCRLSCTSHYLSYITACLHHVICYCRQKIFCSFGCEALGRWDRHEEAGRGSS